MSKDSWSSYRKPERYSLITSQTGVGDVGEAPGMSMAERERAAREWREATGGKPKQRCW